MNELDELINCCKKIDTLLAEKIKRQLEYGKIMVEEKNAKTEEEIRAVNKKKRLFDVCRVVNFEDAIIKMCVSLKNYLNKMKE